MREQWAFLAKTTEGREQKNSNFERWSRQRKKTVQSSYPRLFQRHGDDEIKSQRMIGRVVIKKAF